MKTISGSILASKPITLSKAASSMNKFLSSETGAPTAISSYLRRSAAAFNELVQAHNELKGVRSERKHKHKKSRLETFEENHEENNLDIVVRATDLGEEQSVWYPENSELGSVDEEGRTEERKKKKKRKQTDQIDEVERESGGHVEIEEEEIKEMEKEKEKEKEKKKKKKKRKQTDQIDEVERESGGHVEIVVEEIKETEKEKKKKKRKQTDQIDEVERESGGHIEIEVEEIKETKKEKKKKRKKPVIEDECLDDSEERHRMKKKKWKHEIKT